MSRLSRSASLALAALGLALMHPAQAQTIIYAQDDASAYITDFMGTGANNTTITQPNHGTGFNPLVFQNTGSSYAGWYLGAGEPVGTGTNNNTFSLYAGPDNYTSATRSFNFSPNGVTPPVAGATTPLLAGQTFATSFQNHYISNGNTVGFSLANSAGAALFTFDFLGGTNDYRVTDATGTITDFVPGYTEAGLDTSFTLTGANTFTFSAAKRVGSVSHSYSGTVGGAIDRIVYFDNHGGPSSDVKWSAMSITTPVAAAPEPSQMAVLAICALGLGGLMLARRRQNMRLA